MAGRERNDKLPFATDLALSMSPTNTFDVDAAARQRKYQECWNKGGQSLLLAYADSAINLRPGLHRVCNRV